MTICCPRTKFLLISNATCMWKTRNILTLSMLVYYNKASIFLSEKFLTYALPGLFSSLIKDLIVSEHILSSFWSCIISCCFLILLLPNIVSSKGLFRFRTSISRYVYLLLVSCLINIFSTAVTMPAVFVLRALANVLQ